MISCPRCARELTYISVVRSVSGFSFERAEWDEESGVWLRTNMLAERYSPEIIDDAHHAFACPSCGHELDDHLNTDDEGDLIPDDPDLWPNEMMERLL